MIFQRLVILGQYDLTVKRGLITIMGASVTASSTVHRVCAPASHALPVIRFSASEEGHAELSLKQCKDGLKDLRLLSPLFDNIWNEEVELFDTAESSMIRPRMKNSTFQLVRPSTSL